MHRHPRSLAEAVAGCLSRGENRDGAPSVLLGPFLDVFYTETDSWVRRRIIEADPPLVGDARQDAYVGAVAEHLARRWGLWIPAWSDALSQMLREPWAVGMMGEALAGMLLVERPLAVRRRLIFTEAEPLRRARMPLDPPPVEVAQPTP